MKLYELTYLVSPELSEEELKNLQGKINSFLKECGADLKKEQNPRRIKLGMPVKKKKNAYLGYSAFDLSPEKIEKLKKDFSSFSEIIRFSCIIKRKFAKKFARVKPIKKLGAQAARPSKNKKVELKEIEEKLEEILGE